MPEFGIAGLSGCTDATFTYRAISMPSFVTFDEVTNTFTFDSQSLSDIGSHTIEVEGTLVNGQIHIGTLALTVSTPCGNPEVALSLPSYSPSLITYTALSEPIYISLSSGFISSPYPGCPIEYTLLEADSTGVYTTAQSGVGSLVPNTLVTMIYASSIASVGLHKFALNAAVFGGTASQSAYFEVSIIDACWASSISFSVLHDTTMTYMSTSQLINKLQWFASSPLCSQPVVYSLSPAVFLNPFYMYGSVELLPDNSLVTSGTLVNPGSLL